MSYVAPNYFEPQAAAGPGVHVGYRGLPRGLLGTLPDASVGPYRGPQNTLDKMAETARGDRGERSMLVRQFTEYVLRDVWPKDYLSELLVVRNLFVQPSPTRRGSALFRFTNDPRGVELLKTPEKMVRDILEHGSTLVDCDETTTMAATMLLQVGRAVELVAMGFAPRSLSHVALRALEPKSNIWLLLDGVAGPRERAAAGGAKEILIRRLD